MLVESVNPATGSVLARYERHDGPELERRLQRAADGQRRWSTTDFATRADRLRAIAQQLRARARPFAELIAGEMGKPLEQGVAEAQKCAAVCDYYAANAEAFLAPETVTTEGAATRVVYRPLGVVLALMPWNFPFWQLCRFAAPALMAGNAAVLRHASNVTGCALAIEQLFREAETPLTLLLAQKSEVPKLIEDARISAVTLTGSTAAGRVVAAAAGRALKKTVLELGGSDPYVVLADADLDLAVERCVTSRLINSGQSCIAAKRFIVEAPVHDRFVAAFVAAMRAKRAGDPLDAASDLGPLAQARTRQRLHDQVQRSVALGARCELGGELPPSPGFFYPPTVLTQVRPGMPVFDEEVFGPVAAIVAAADADAAIELANRSRYGLGAAVFTRDAQCARDIAARRLEAGNCFINDFVRSDPRLPFGGIKESGYGRELGVFGIKEFVNIKTVWTGG
jgi:succinate-semialdehyde dehydrogenase / glutarate-semialdehyde dehydrogenase